MLPAGPAGHTPKLALVYESQSARGPAGQLGLGWRLEGLSVIERDRKFGPPYDLSRPLGGAFAYRNDFVLDAQDVIFDSSSSGRDRYRTQRDDGRLIEYIPAQNKWEIRDREGRLLVYGASADRRVNNDKTGQTFSWLLERIDDAHGNRITYAYQILSGVPYLNYVFWGQGANINRQVTVHRSGYWGLPRPDQLISYSAGFRQKTEHRITRIDMHAFVAGVWKPTNYYELLYDQDPHSGRSRLESVVRRGADWNSSQAAHTFAYTESTPGFSASSTTYVASAPGIEPAFMEENSFWTLTTVTKEVIDLDGDAIADVYKLDGSEHNRWPGDGEEFLNAPEGWTNGVLRTDVTTSSSVETWIDTLDINGDRIPDRIDSNLPDWYVSLGSPAGMTGSATWVSSVSRLRKINTASGDKLTTRDLVDLTGDGLPDRVDSTGPGASWSVRPNAGISGGQGGWLGPQSWSDPANTWIRYRTSGGDDRALLFDVNGDGLQDRVYHNGASWRVAFNFGGGFDAATAENLANAPANLSLTSGTCKTRHLVDINGDGFPDHVSASGSQWTVKFGTGNGFQAAGVDWTPTWSGGGSDPRSCVIDHAQPNGNSTLHDLVFQGGANSTAQALNTIAHEYKHLDPGLIRAHNKRGFRRRVAESIARRYGDNAEAIYRGKQ